MSGLALASFAVIFGIACATPGPSISALIARVIGRGTAGTPFFCAGLLLGDLIWLACAVFGLAAIAAQFQPVSLAVKYLGAAYLLVLAWKMWTAPAEAASEHQIVKGDGFRLFLGGLALAMGNPKTMLFYLAILPAIVDLPHLTGSGVIALETVVAIVYGGVLTAYVVLAARMRRLVRNARAVRAINRVTGTVMGGAAAAVALRS
jgi:threonine/homoserine/homoserine lactone efflux protein